MLYSLPLKVLEVMSHAKGKLCNLWHLRNLWFALHTDMHTSIEAKAACC